MTKKPIILLSTEGKTMEESIEEAKVAFRKFKKAEAKPMEKTKTEEVGRWEVTFLPTSGNPKTKDKA